MSQLSVEDLLRKVLTEEQKRAFDNQAMMGGLSAFARRLHSEAPAGSSVPEAALLLVSYDEDEPSARRAAAIAAIAALDGAIADRQGSAQVTVSRAVPAGAGTRGRGNAGPSRQLESEQGGSRTRRQSDAVKPSPPPAVEPRLTSDVRLTADAKDILSQPIDAVSGVGPKKGRQLADAGLATLGDALYYFPREHLDYRRRDRIRSLNLGERTTILVTVEGVRVRRIRKNLSITTVMVSDQSGRIAVEWFNQPYLEKTFRIGRQIAISGELDLFGDRRTFRPRDYEFVDQDELTHAARLVPIYPLKKGLHQKSLRSLLRRAVADFVTQVPDPLPEYLRQAFDLPGLAGSIARYHFPDSEKDAHEARRRLAFDEVLVIQLGLRLRKLELESAGGAPELRLSDSDRAEFLGSLPFEPTNAQRKVMAQLERSLASSRPMSRLVQGDVGSGKTVVAALALFSAAKAGYQSVIMAPTEILAQQHFASLRNWLEPAGVKVALLTGSTPGVERGSILAAAAEGDIDVLAGTHALFQEAVEMKRLGVAVVDEQHRFGVEQRSKLRQKGVRPHLLAMTATPIPRTLQLTLYGDLDISIIDEMPPGRVPIETRLYAAPHHAYNLADHEMAKGRQGFVVCPVIDESLDEDMKSAIAEHQRLQTQVFPNRRIGLLHGRMKSKEKDEVLRSFRDHEFQLLVATSVVEVGIDVPNATIMIIRDAHRFGLAQLHQLRGRIGRGSEQSYCVLVSGADEGPTFERLRAVVESQDGFKLAEKDLEIRGPGDFWGTRQSGLPDLKMAGPGDGPLIEAARTAADMILERDPALAGKEHAPLRAVTDRVWSQAAQLH